MAITRAVLTVATTVLLLQPPAFSAGPPLDLKSFRELHALIKPKATEEIWIRIPG